MNQEETKSLEIIRNRVEEFNIEVTAKASYERRRKVLKTPVIFYDSELSGAPQFCSSGSNWCKISSNLRNYISQVSHSELIIRYETNEESKLLENEHFISQCRKEIPDILKSLVSSYLNLYFDISSSYPSGIMIRIRNKIINLKSRLISSPMSILSLPNIIISLSKEIKQAKRCVMNEPIDRPISKNSDDRVQLLIKLKSESKHTVREICEMCGFSPSTYYSYCRRIKSNERGPFKMRGRQYTENSLNDAEKKFIKALVDDPKFCYTVPQICNELFNTFHRNMSKKKVYTYISKGLGYSYKFNSYSAPLAFDPSQNIIRFKIARKLIECYSQEKSIIFLDETSIDLTLCRTRSYAKKGSKPYRMRNMKSERLNIIMAITKENVYCYQVIKGTTTEFDFINLISSLLEHISKSNRKDLSQYILVLDNYSSHCSALALQMLRLFKIQTLFTPIYYCFLNPIETYFSSLKRSIRKSFRNDM